MKALVCEMCSGNDVVKQDGYFVCQHCGTKYTAEEARKLIIEGSIDISGSKISVENLQSVKTMEIRSEEFEKKKEYGRAIHYIEKAIDIDPTNQRLRDTKARLEKEENDENNKGCLFGLLLLSPLIIIFIISLFQTIFD